jgi:hypothetical protein
VALCAIVTLALARDAAAQACCAGAGVVTPGRLALHEDELVGVQLHASALLGSFDAQGSYLGEPSTARELDLEQDLFGSVRVFKHGQISLLVPLVETSRQESGLSDFGGGIGDINLSGRWDFFNAGASRYLPGIAVLVGVTFPTGVPIESASDVLGADTTGTGAFQLNGGLAFEQVFGPWLVGISGILAARLPRTVGTVTSLLAPQWTALATLAYVTQREIALAVSVSLAYEGDASINGASVEGSEHETTAVTFGALFPVGDTWRIQTGVAWNPPVFGRNQIASLGFVWTLVHTWL